MQPVLPISFGLRLQVVPSAHHRMVFAEAVIAGCRRTRFDVIAVELPRAYESPAVVEGIRRVLPHTGLLVVGAEKPGKAVGGAAGTADARVCGSAAEDLRRFAGGPRVRAGLLPV
jgi:hypothetical protein